MHICIHNNINYNRRKRKRRAQNTACSRPVFFSILDFYSKFPGIISWCGVSSLFLFTFPKQCRFFGLTLASIFHSWLILSCRWFNLLHTFLTSFSCLVYSHHCGFGLVWFWICDLGTPSANKLLDTGPFGHDLKYCKCRWKVCMTPFTGGSLPSFQCTHLRVAIHSTNP